MIEQVLAAVVALALGGFAIAAWWFAMFSDSVWGDLAREMLDGVFSLGRNTIAVVEPAVWSAWCFSDRGSFSSRESIG